MNYSNLKSQKTWGLVDCDSFFASCEIIKTPFYKGKNLVVGKDIVIAATYEAKNYGIKIGMPIWEAQKIVDNLIVCLPDIRFYGKISQNVMSILGQYSNSIEIFSIDEAFIDLTGKNVEYNMDIYTFVCFLQYEILNRVGIPVSIGVGPTRLISKIFANINKPFGNFILFDEKKIDGIFSLLPIRLIPFIGKKSEEKLFNYCKTIYDFKKFSYGKVRRLLKGNGLKIRFEINSVNSLSFYNNSLQKGLSRTKSFNPYFTNDKNKLFQYLVYNFERAFEELIFLGMKTKFISIFIKRKDFSKYKIDLILPDYTFDKTILIENVKIMFEKIYVKGFFYRSTGIFFGLLKFEKYIQGSLFPAQGNNYKLWKIINDINKKYGRFIVTSAANGVLRNSNLNDIGIFLNTN